MALLVVPAFCTNLWQGFIGTILRYYHSDYGSLLLAVIPCVWAGVALSDLFEMAILTRFLGGLVVIYGAIISSLFPIVFGRRCKLGLGLCARLMVC